MRDKNAYFKISFFSVLQLLHYRFVTPALAQGSRIDNPVINPNLTAQEGSASLQLFLSAFVGVMTVVGAFIFLYVLVTGAIQFITSEGDKNAYETARKKITMGIVGLVFIVAAIFIAEVVAQFLGVPDIFNLPAMVNGIANLVE